MRWGNALGVKSFVVVAVFLSSVALSVFFCLPGLNQKPQLVELCCSADLNYDVVIIFRCLTGKCIFLVHQINPLI